MSAIILLQACSTKETSVLALDINDDSPSMKQSIKALDVKISAHDAKINHDFTIMKLSLEALGSKISSFFGNTCLFNCCDLNFDNVSNSQSSV